MSRELVHANRILGELRPTELAGVRVARIVTGKIRQAALRQVQGQGRQDLRMLLVEGMLPTLTKAMMVGHSFGARRARLLVKQLSGRTKLGLAFDEAQHPRDEKGRFGEGGGSSSNVSSSKLSQGTRIKGTLYHGKLGRLSIDENREGVVFFSEDKQGASWYAIDRGAGDGKPTITSVDANVKVGTRNDLDTIVKELNVSDSEIEGHGGDPQFPYDAMYVPRVRRELQAHGFQGVRGSDILGNSEIDAVILISMKGLKVASHQEINNYVNDTSSNVVTLKLSRIQLAVFDDVLKAVKAKRELDLDVLKDNYEPRAFQVLMGLGKDIDEKIQDVIDELISSGASTREATKTLGEVLEKAGVSGTSPSKLETLFRTQLQVAFGAGRWQADQDPDIQEILWGYKYVTVGDDRVRPEHEALDGVTLPKGDPFWQTFWPPNGWNCRCQAIPIFEERKIVKPSLVDGLPAEPDDGFDFNAGELLDDAELELGLAFDPDQPRDAHGQWSSGGGGGNDSLPSEGVKDLTFVKNLGGTTGAELRKDAGTGKLYVLKRGKSPAHVTAESQANDAYRAMGVRVPNSKLYKDGTGTYMISEFVKGKKLNELTGPEKDAAYGKLKEGFVADALLGNWDAIGTGADNIIVDEKGDVWRIDNGGALAFRAQGALKGDKWNGDVNELQTLRDPTKNHDAAKAYAGLTDTDIKGQITKVLDKNGDLPVELQKDKIMQARLETLSKIEAGVPTNATPAQATAKTYLHSVPVTSTGTSSHSFMGKTPHDRLGDLQKKVPKTAANLSQFRKVAMMNDGSDNSILYLPDSFDATEQSAFSSAFPGKKVKLVNASKHLAPLMAQHKVANPHQLWQAHAKGVTPSTSTSSVATHTAAPVKKISGVKKAPKPGPIAKPTDKSNYTTVNLPTSLRSEAQIAESLKWAGSLHKDEASACARWKGNAQWARSIEKGVKQAHIDDKQYAKNVEMVKQFHQALDKSPKYEGTLYRGCTHVQPGTEFHEALKTPGSVVEFESSACSSRKASTAFSFGHNGTVFVIKSKTAAMIEDTDGHKSEQENVIRKGSQHRVISIQENVRLSHGSHAKLLVHLEEITDKVPDAKLLQLAQEREEQEPKDSARLRFLETEPTQMLKVRLPASSWEELSERDLDEKIREMWEG